MKITDMQAACGVAQLKKLNSFIEKRKKNHDFLLRKLEHFSDIIYLPTPEKNSDPSWFGFYITLKNKSKINRRDLINKLNEKKIGTRLVFAGNLTKQPAYINKKFNVNGELNNTNYIMENTFWVGIHPSLGEEELSYTATCLTDNLK